MTERSQRPSPGVFEPIVAVHIAVFMVGVSWAFGGNADWVRTPISLWGSVGILLTLAMVLSPAARGKMIPGTLAWCLPIVALNVLVLGSCLTPGMRSLSFGGEGYLMPLRVPWWVPSAGRPDSALRALWLFDGIYFSCLNIALCIAKRRSLRILLAVSVGNALALSVFGTVQKLMGSTGIYFGSVKSPQDYFFASFVYDNHWGAFIILMIGACLGLVLRYLQSPDGGGVFHGPAFSGLVAAFFIGVSVPLSGSRACTLLLGIMVIVAFARGAPTVKRNLQAAGIGPTGVRVAVAFAAILAGWGIWMVAGDVINSRASKAREQIAAIWAQGGLGARSTLYHDTWRMARARPLFGWGMGSFPSVFALYNTQLPRGDRIPVVYHDAHSDWLQSVAEIGFAGTILVGAAVALPAWSTRRRRVTSIPFFLCLGALLVSIYAWIEFPFGNVAVVLGWWLCFFSAVQYIRLTDPPGTARRPA